jgi:membrane-associated protease RseP (regulator of RpoE activity)
MKSLPAALLTGGLCFALAAFLFAGDSPGRPAAEAPAGGSSQAAVEDRASIQVAFQDAAAPQKTAAAAAPDLSWIGVMLEDGPEKSVKVSSVFPGGPAAFAGVRVGDRLAKVGDAETTTLAKAVEAIEKLPPKAAATMTVFRDGKSLSLMVNTQRLADFHERYVREMLRRDPRDPQYTHQHGVSEADMQVELVRRLFEQNQRLETTLNVLVDEIQGLRAELKQKKN